MLSQLSYFPTSCQRHVKKHLSFPSDAVKSDTGILRKKRNESPLVDVDGLLLRLPETHEKVAETYPLSRCGLGRSQEENTVTWTRIRKQLPELAEEEYRRFSAKLLPGVDRVLGVRLPVLRGLAKQAAKEDWRGCLATEPTSFEELMLQGMIIGYAAQDIEEVLRLVAVFLPQIDNWSVCDSFCTGLKITRRYRERVWEFLQPYQRAEHEFAVRFYTVMLLFFYVDDVYIDRVLEALDGVRHEGYYVKMAVAWAISVCFVKQRGPTLAYLRHSHLDTFTYNKALQKITESLAVDAPTKAMIRKMKRKAQGKAGCPRKRPED